MDEPNRMKRKVFIPNDFLKSISSLEYKTVLLGDLSRFCCIYKIDEIYFYDMEDQWKEKGFELELINDVLNYLMTPQYIRKHVFQKKKTLNSVGLLHPLNTPNHPVEKESLDAQMAIGSTMYRQGIIKTIIGKIGHVDIGLENDAELTISRGMKINQIIDLKIDKTADGFLIVPVEKDAIPLYWGYKVIFIQGEFKDILEESKKNDLLVATSKRGTMFKDFLTSTQTFSTRGKKNVSLFFGPRAGGLMQFFKSVDEFLSAFDYVINCFDAPGTKSIRLEEAIPITLSIIVLLCDREKKPEKE
jgi:methyltransferase